MTQTVWIVDDEPAICWALRRAFEEQGYRVDVFSAAEPFCRALADQVTKPNLVFLDVRLPGISGIELLSDLQQSHPQLPVVLMTAFGDLKIAVDAVRGKAFEYLTKPFTLETALHAAQRALRLQREGLPESTEPAEAPIHAALGRAPVMQDVYKQIAAAASNPWPVLISGDQGVGKSVVCRLIHQFSERRDHPLLTYRPNPDDPMECLSELFGVEEAGPEASATSSTREGAGTAEFAEAMSDASPHRARPRRRGLLDLAAQGTVVVDEVTLLPRTVQTRMLEAIESRKYLPLSANRQKNLSARLIFTTSSRLDAALADGELYPQFHSQLQVCAIHLPSLAEHREDIPMLARAALKQLDPDGSLKLTDRAAEELARRRWRGNLRELNQAIQRAAVKASAGVVDIEDLPAAQNSPQADDSQTEVNRDLDRAVRSWMSQHLADSDRGDETVDSSTGFLHERCMEVVERAMIESVLAATDGNRASAAELLGIHRTTMRQKAKRLGID